MWAASPFSTSVILVIITVSCKLLIWYNKIAYYQLTSFDLFYCDKERILSQFLFLPLQYYVRKIIIKPCRKIRFIGIVSYIYTYLFFFEWVLKCS